MSTTTIPTIADVTADLARIAAQRNERAARAPNPLAPPHTTLAATDRRVAIVTPAR